MLDFAREFRPGCLGFGLVAALDGIVNGANPNSEFRNPKEIRIPKPENAEQPLSEGILAEMSRTREFLATAVNRRAPHARDSETPPTKVSAFGFRISGFFRISDFGPRIYHCHVPRPR